MPIPKHRILLTQKPKKILKRTQPLTNKKIKIRLRHRIQLIEATYIKIIQNENVINDKRILNENSSLTRNIRTKINEIYGRDIIFEKTN